MNNVYLFRIEVIRPRDLDVRKEVLVSICGYRRSDPKGTLRVDGTCPTDLHVAMGRDRCYGQKEWLGSLDRIIKKTLRFVSQDIGGVFSLVADRGISVPLPSAVEIFVRIRVQEEVRASKSSRIRAWWFSTVCALKSLPV